MKKTVKHSMLLLLGFGIAIAYSIPSAQASIGPEKKAVNATCTGGGEDKKKDQEATTTEDGDASKAKDAEPTVPVAEPKPEPKPAEYKVNSFNFLFEMLYHFNVIETARLQTIHDPSHEGFYAGIPLYQGKTAFVSH